MNHIIKFISSNLLEFIDFHHIILVKISKLINNQSYLVNFLIFTSAKDKL